MNKTGKLLVCLAILMSASLAYADTYKVAIKDLPLAPALQRLFAAVAEETKSSFEFQVVPAARMIALVEQGQVDIGYPQNVVADPARVASLKYDFGSSVVYSLVYVLYTNKSRPVDLANLRAGNSKNYVIETNASNVSEYGFSAAVSSSVEASLKKVDAGRIDGCIYGMATGDASLKELGLANVKRQDYMHADTGFLLKKGQKGGSLDRSLSAALQSLRRSGRYAQVSPELLQQNQFVEW